MEIGRIVGVVKFFLGIVVDGVFCRLGGVVCVSEVVIGLIEGFVGNFLGVEVFGVFLDDGILGFFVGEGGRVVGVFLSFIVFEVFLWEEGFLIGGIVGVIGVFFEEIVIFCVSVGIGILEVVVVEVFCGVVGFFGGIVVIFLEGGVVVLGF